MNDLEFYRYIYDRELNRRSKLDDSINVIIATISLLIGLSSYFLTNKIHFEFIKSNVFLIFLSFFTMFGVAISILFLIKSYNNYLRGFNYPNISYLSNIRMYQKVIIPDYNNKVDENKKVDFEDDLIDRIVRITDENTRINDKRSYDLYVSKTSIILALMFIFILSIILITKQS